MSNAPKKILPKPSSNRDGCSESDVPVGEKDLSVSELKALHEKLAALRAADAVALPEEKEHMSVRALIAYAACDLGVNESVVTDLVARHFGVTDISEMHEDYRSTLIRFLENLDIKQFIN
jgi:hypothetical protein